MRTAVLTISTAAILVALFLGYRQLVVDPAPPEHERGEAFDGLPVAHPPGAEGSLRVGAIEVPPGGQIIFTVYDPHTGRPTDRVRCEEWSSVPGTKNEIAVKKPELAMRLPSGLIATITADAGQLAVDRVQNTRMRPQHGWLRGGARIVIDRDREGAIDDPAATQPTDDERIVITMDRLEFDLQLGMLRTTDRIQLESRDFEVAGEGLDLVWNQADNQVESLQIARGERLVLFGAGGLLGQPTAPTDAAALDPSPSDTRAEPRRRSTARAKRGGATAYVCTLSGGIRAVHQRGEQSLGELVAEDLRLTFDIGGGARDLLGARRDRVATTQPRESREQLVVTWSGPLRLGPTSAPARREKNRRRLEASGNPVILNRGDGSIRCGRLEYYEDSGQIWLHAPTGGAVDLTLRSDLTARAGSIYVDRSRDIVKLIGDVRLESHHSSASGAPRRFAVRAAQWAELHLEPSPVAADSAADDPAPAPRTVALSAAPAAVAEKTRAAEAPSAADALGYSGLRGATFVGAVVVDLGDQELRTHRLDTTFHEDATDDSLEAALRRAVASGGAVLKARDERLECVELRLEFARSDSGEVYPRAVDAFGNVLIEQQESSLRGGRVQAQLDAPPPKAAGASGPAFVIRSLRVADGAALDDPRNRVSARGAALDATFTADNQLDRAVITGNDARPARVRASPYVVSGPRIEMSENAQTLDVAGRSELRFRSERGLQGERRARAAPVIIRADRRLHIDGRGNVVRFVDNVVARSGDDELRADQLTITLEDVATPARRPRPRMDTWDFVVNAARSLARGEAPALSPAAPRPSARPNDGARSALRKEIVRIKADNAVAQNETIQPGDSQPLVHSSLAAAVMDVDVVQRVIRTSGRTTLLMTNRRVSDDDSPGREALGLPSSLITRGASQTAMQCDGSMTYVFGASGPQRQDNVLFEGGVVLVHKAGREMVNIDQMLPQLAGDKEALARMKSRNAYLECRRLEVAFGPGANEAAGDDSGLSARSNLRLNWLMASGDVYLRDKQGTGTRTVNADSVEFDRAHGLVRVLGTPSVDARVQFEDPAAGRFDQPAIGPLFIIDLQANTIRTDRVEGIFRRGGG